MYEESLVYKYPVIGNEKGVVFLLLTSWKLFSEYLTDE